VVVDLVIDVLAPWLLLPPHPTLDNYKSIFKNPDFTHALRNSAIVSLTTTFLALLVGSFCAYAIARLKFRRKFWLLALILSYWVGVKLHWLPSQGYVHPTDDFVGHLRSMALPAISLAVGQIAAYMRLLRSDMIATLQEDFILMAKAKGITNRRILWRHALRPSSLTLLTVAGLQIGALIGGTVVIEVIFGIPGMGTLLYTAIAERQFVMLQSLVVVIAIVAIVALIFLGQQVSSILSKVGNSV